MALTVRDIMDADPFTVGPDDDVEISVRRLRRHVAGIVLLEPRRRYEALIPDQP
jgi:hypothetical protein